MRFLFITEFFPSTKKKDFSGGVENRYYHLAQKLSENHTVIIICSKEINKPLNQNIGRIVVHRVGIQRKYSRGGNIIPRISFIISSLFAGMRLQIDYVEGGGFFAWIPAYLIGKFKKVRKVLFIADTMESYMQGFLMHPMKLFEKFMLNQNWDSIITISMHVRNKLPLNAKNHLKCKVFYCGINEQIIDSKKNNVIKKYSFICVSRLVYYKNIELLIKAFSNIKNKYSESNLLIVGEGENRRILQNLVSKLGLNESVKFTGFVKTHNQVLKLISESYIFCFPSQVEGFGIAPLEAMSLGVPVIVANLPIYSETIGKNGIYFSLNSINDFSKKMLLLLQHKEKYEKYSQLGLNQSKKFFWSNLFKKQIPFYENMHDH